MKILQFIKHIPLIVRYGLILSAGLILLKTLEYQLFSYRFSLELYSGLLALFFLFIGVAVAFAWLRRSSKLMQHKNYLTSETLTPKERNLLRGIAEGLSNQQLAEQHYLSVNTIKTHLQRIYRKLEVNSRYQAVEKAKSLELL